MSGLFQSSVPPRGFEHISRFWDSRQGSYIIKVKPGEYYVSGADEPITTTLGSCVAVCVRDKRLKIGGMNHFMLPGHLDCDGDTPCTSGSARYGNYAMEHLINTLYSQGARRADLEFKVFGGGAVLRNDTQVGESNIRFLRAFLAKEGYSIASEDLGGTAARRVMYFPVSGRAMVKHMDTDTSQVDAVIREEESHRRSLGGTRDVIGEIELF